MYGGIIYNIHICSVQICTVDGGYWTTIENNKFREHNILTNNNNILTNNNNILTTNNNILTNNNNILTNNNNILSNICIQIWCFQCIVVFIISEKKVHHRSIDEK